VVTPDGNDALFPRMVVGDDPIRAGEVLCIYYGPDFDRSWEGSGRTDSTQWESGHAEARGPDLSGIIGSELDEVGLRRPPLRSASRNRCGTTGG
jgi:hypothetical protein